MAENVELQFENNDNHFGYALPSACSPPPPHTHT